MLHGLHHLGVGHGFLDDHGNVALHGLVLGHGLEHRHLARQHGIEVSVLHPGNAETAIFGKNLTTAKTNEGMMEPANVAQVALTIVSAPSGTNVLSSVVLPTRQPYLGRG